MLRWVPVLLRCAQRSRASRWREALGEGAAPVLGVAQREKELSKAAARHAARPRSSSRNPFPCPACGNIVSEHKYHRHLMHCAEDLIPAGVKWPGAAEAFAHAHAAEATLRAEILRLRFGGSEPPNDLRHQNLPTAEVANKMGVSEARVAKAIRMASRQVPLVADRPAPAWVQRAILFEDDDLLVINKPPGINHHPKHRWAGGSLLNAVMGYVADQREANDGESLNEESVFPVHRLDAETSGVTVFAKSRASASVLGQMMCRDVSAT
jgi:hypothetical protein